MPSTYGIQRFGPTPEFIATLATSKGHEFFHKLITQARKNRIMHGQQGQGPSTPIGGQPARPLPGPSRFNSRPQQQMGR